MAYNSINIGGVSAADSLKIKNDSLKTKKREFRGRISKAHSDYKRSRLSDQRPAKGKRPSGVKPSKTREEAKAREDARKQAARSSYEKAVADYKASKGKK